MGESAVSIMAPPGDITGLLSKVQQGDSVAADKLATLVYGELRVMAARAFRKERIDHTLQPTALVNEAFVKLLGSELPSLQNRAHFFAIASGTMRTLLIDHARKKNTGKHGGGWLKVELDENLAHPTVDSKLLLALGAALEQLEILDARKAKIVEMRFFGGMTNQEIAQVLGISITTVGEDWRRAKAWLKRELDS